MDREILDIFNGLFSLQQKHVISIKKIERMHHIVDTFQHRKSFRVFSCSFSTGIVGSKYSTAAIVANTSKFTRCIRNLKDTSGEDDWWCPINIAPTSESNAKGTHFVVAEKFLWSKSLSIFDSLSNDGSFLETSDWIARRLSIASNQYLAAQNRQSNWKFQIPAPNVPQEPNSCDCALHVSARPYHLLFEMNYSVATIRKMRPNMPVFILAACRVL